MYAGAECIDEPKRRGNLRSFSREEVFLMKTQSFLTIGNMSEFANLALTVPERYLDAERSCNQYQQPCCNSGINILNLPVYAD